MEPEKPFACSMPDCGMTFTNEDHLHVHTKKHDMVLQLGMGQKAAFVADQTPTPTRFIRNCEEVGLFQDLQNVAVNPFDEGFKRAMETKQCLLTLEGPPSSEDVLHTPHLVFPIESGDCTLYTANNQRNITISRSSSDESGKEYETTKISKLTNEVTTISRIIGKDDASTVKHEESNKNKDILNETSVSYKNNIIIHSSSNVEIRQGIDIKKVSNNTDSVIKDPISIDELVKLSDNNKFKEVPPIMSQKSLDFVVDSLTTDVFTRDDSLNKNLKRNVDKNDRLHEKLSPKRNLNNKTKVTIEKDKNVDNFSNDCNYEVVIKLPNGKQMKMKAVDEVEKPINAKEKLNSTIINKIHKPAIPISSPIVQNIVPITTGTLIPVTLMNPNLTINPNLMNYNLQVVQKIPIQPLSSTIQKNFKSVKRKNVNGGDKYIANAGNVNKCKETESNVNKKGVLQKEKESSSDFKGKIKESHCAASKRYRQRLKESMHKQRDELKNLREMNRKLSEEKAVLQMIITQHLKDCPQGRELSRNLQEKLQSINNKTE